MTLINTRALGINLADTFNFTGTLQQHGGASAGGKVLQAVNQVYSTEVTSTSTSLGNTGIDLSITPSATSSKVLVLVNCGQIEIEVNLTKGLEDLYRCNCSMCKRKGAISTVIDKKDLKVTKG